MYDNFSDTTSSPTSITLSVGYDLAVLDILSVLFCFILSYPVSQIPYYGDTGLNSGVMLIDLDRVRKLVNGWTGMAESIEFVYQTHNQFVLIDANFFYSGASLEITDKYRSRIKLGDQDILNILFR